MMRLALLSFSLRVSWFASLHRNGSRPRANQHLHLSTGMRGVLLAMRVCRSLTPFGFAPSPPSDAHANGSRRLLRYHYWEEPSPRSLLHGAENMSFEHEVIAAWQRSTPQQASQRQGKGVSVGRRVEEVKASSRRGTSLDRSLDHIHQGQESARSSLVHVCVPSAMPSESIGDRRAQHAV